MRRAGRSRALALSLALAGAAGGCCARPWDKFPMSPRPDRSCRTGTVQGDDVYIWQCVNNQHVVVYAYSAEMSCQDPARETAACGAQTPIEKTLGTAVAEGCTPVPDGLQWP